MRKVFTLTLVFLAMMFSVNAQYLLQEGFEGTDVPTGWTIIDNDGDGNNWYVLNNSQSSSGGFVVHSGEGHITSASWASEVLTPDNWLITPAINLTADATLSFWVAGQDPSYAAENYSVYISTTGATVSDFTTLLMTGTSTATMTQQSVNLSNYTGQTVYIAFRHHNISDMFRLNLDDVEIFAQPTEPTLSVTPASINFGTALLGGSLNATANVLAYNLTSNVNASTTAPFAVSADGSTFGTTASLPATGGVLYLRYTPTAAGTDNGTVTLSSTGVSNSTINLTASAIECNASIPYSYSFTDETINQCWTIEDANGDGYTFTFDTEYGEAAYSYNTDEDADDWLISPYFTFEGTETVQFDYAAYSSYYPERFQVFAIGADTISLTPIIDVTSETPTTQFISLNNVTGTYQIGIHCVSLADNWKLLISNFAVSAGAPASTATLSTDVLAFSTLGIGSVSNPKVVVLSTVSIDEDITLTTSAPFEVSLDGASYAASKTIPANSNLTTTDSIFVRFAPTTVGNFNQTMTVTSTTINETVTLTGSSVDCSEGITTFPFVEDFNDGNYPPACWGYNNEENFSGIGVDQEASDYAISIDAIDMLITPEITTNDPVVLMFDYANYLGGLGETPSTFRVGYSTTTNEVSSFTWMPSITFTDFPEEPALFFNYTSELPAGTKYVAIDVLELGTYLYFGILELPDAIYIDNFSLLTDPTLMVSAESLEFGSVIVGTPSNSKVVSVTGALLTNDINVSAPANFEVSVNGTSFASTVTIPQAGGNLFVRYNPSSAGYHSGNVTLTCGSISKVITVAGNAVDCSTPYTLPFSENFDNGLDNCWATPDADGDGYSWEPSTNPVSYYSGVDLSGTGHNESFGFVLSGSYSNALGMALSPDNWLITPALIIPSEGATLSFYVSAQDANYANEHYGVYVSTTGINPSDFTLLYEEDLDADGGPRAQGAWKQKVVNLPYGGQTIHLAIRHFNCYDMFLINVDDFTVTPGVGVESHELTTKVFPNPANNVLNINANANINRVEVYNMMGQLVGMYNVNDMNTQINTTSFANGVYTVKIETENGTTTKKFTVAR